MHLRTISTLVCLPLHLVKFFHASMVAEKPNIIQAVSLSLNRQAPTYFYKVVETHLTHVNPAKPLVTTVVCGATT